MKTLVTLLALAGGLAIMTPTTAQAGHGSSFSSARCGNCGDATYRQRVIIGYQRCGDPIYGWRNSAHRCAPRHDHHYAERGHNGHRSSGHGRGHGR